MDGGVTRVVVRGEMERCGGGGGEGLRDVVREGGGRGIREGWDKEV